MRSNPHLVVIGGYTDDLGMLEGVADVGVRSGMAHDAEVALFRDALGRYSDRMPALVKDAMVITHSAGVLALHGVGVETDSVSIVAGVEPVTIPKLLGKSLLKTKEHVIGETDQPRTRHLRATCGNVLELARHPFANNRHVPRISRASTSALLLAGEIWSERIGHFQMEDDTFFPFKPSRTDEVRGMGHVSEVLPGGHDEILIDPVMTLARISKHMNRS